MEFFVLNLNKALKKNFIFQTYPEKISQNDIVDFNGAGDAFLGGFLSQQIQNQTLENCCRCGNHTAAVVIKQLGCNFPKN